MIWDHWSLILIQIPPKELNLNLYILLAVFNKGSIVFFFLNLTGVTTGEEWNCVITDLVEDFNSSFKSAQKEPENKKYLQAENLFLKAEC